MIDLPPDVDPPNEGEYAALLVGFAVIFVVLGLIGHGVLFFAPPQDPVEAKILKLLSEVVILIGLISGIGRWIHEAYFQMTHDP